MENLTEAMQYISNLTRAGDFPKVLEICGKTYSDKKLVRYGSPEKAEPIKARSLTALVDYMGECYAEFDGKKMIINVESPTSVSFESFLDEERDREKLFVCEAEVSCFRFGYPYSQEEFMIALQANFVPSEELDLIMKVAGNVEKKNEQTYIDDGRTQIATMRTGIASKSDVIIPNPVRLIPFRTFQEVEQPESQFVFRISGDDEPTFKIIEAEGGLWKNLAIARIKEYFAMNIPEDICGQIVVIG